MSSEQKPEVVTSAAYHADTDEEDFDVKTSAVMDYDADTDDEGYVAAASSAVAVNNEANAQVCQEVGAANPSLPPSKSIQRMAQLIDKMPKTRRYTDGSTFPPNSDGISISYLSAFTDVIDECAEILKKEFLKNNETNNKLTDEIFNKQYEDDSNTTRSVRYIITPEEIESSPFLEVLKSQIIFHAKQINSKYTHVHSMSLLVSEKGCQKQITHTDGFYHGDQFLSSLFTLNDNTTF